MLIGCLIYTCCWERPRYRYVYIGTYNTISSLEGYLVEKMSNEEVLDRIKENKENAFGYRPNAEDERKMGWICCYQRERNINGSS